jgi:hypothetical protein
MLAGMTKTMAPQSPAPQVNEMFAGHSDSSYNPSYLESRDQEDHGLKPTTKN